jgi:glycosyltransferase involved in cell wall biosynthesis
VRVLQVIHAFPPFSSQGSEMHCLDLSRALLQIGDEVGVFHVANPHRRFPRRLERRSDFGLRVFHCIDGGQYSRVAEWPNAFLRERFAETLEEFAPDAVHFHNYVSLGDDLVAVARSSGASVLYTLHDYGLICPNNLLKRMDGALCEKGSPDFFQDCCPATIRLGKGSTPLLIHGLPPLLRWKQFAANQSGTLKRTALAGLTQSMEAVAGAPEVTGVDRKRSFFLGATQRIVSGTHLFLAPSAFLRERFIRCGLDPSHVVHERYGMRHFPRPRCTPANDGKVRFGYIGAFHAHKGIELLLEAFGLLEGRASLHLYGSSFGSPVSESHFRRVTSDAARGFVVHGRYDNSRVGEILGGLDAVVVPSIWYENSPLVIQEAQIAGVPVITADVGGMAELVRDGVDGLLFRFGDARDLSRVMRSIIDRPEMLDLLRANAPDVPTIEGQALRIRAHYQSAKVRASA